MLRSAESAKKLSLKNADADVDALLERIDTEVYCAASCGKQEAEFSLWGLPSSTILKVKPYLIEKGYKLEKVDKSNSFFNDYWMVKW